MILLNFFQDPLFFMLLIFIVFWLFIIRPKQKQAKKENEFRNELKKGDKVVTAGGIHGRIVGVQEKTVFLECDDIKKIKIEKSMIYRLSSKD
jgi:preprotein translocase subunit YajC